jgi:hypothetical protein
MIKVETLEISQLYLNLGFTVELFEKLLKKY